MGRPESRGLCAINKATESREDVPFGGIKNSGYGRELARFGPRSFVNANGPGNRLSESDRLFDEDDVDTAGLLLVDLEDLSDEAVLAVGS
jgi:hypothetical protein